MTEEENYYISIPVDAVMKTHREYHVAGEVFIIEPGEMEVTSGNVPEGIEIKNSLLKAGVYYNGEVVREYESPKNTPEVKEYYDLPTGVELIRQKTLPQNQDGRIHFESVLVEFTDGSRSRLPYTFKFNGLNEEETQMLIDAPESKTSGAPIKCADGKTRHAVIKNGVLYRGSGCGASISGAFESIIGM